MCIGLEPTESGVFEIAARETEVAMYANSVRSILYGVGFWLAILESTAVLTAASAAATQTTSPALRASSQAATRTRDPAVAGLFYPKDKAELSRNLEEFLRQAPAESISDLKALICPHAGYPYSGPTAACAYRLLLGRAFDTVLIMGPSHYAAFVGASVSGADTWRTPLGAVTVSERARELAGISPFIPEASCRVERPAWSAISSRPLPQAGEETPHTWEHSVEVQVPFLQAVQKGAKIVPVVFGDVDPAKAAQALAGWIDNKTLLIASSDLSHYHSYTEARELDQRCVKAIRHLDVTQMQSQEACGKFPILTLLHLARLKGWRARLLDYRNSGDTAGDKSRVVGYAALAFYAPGPENLGQEERRFLLNLARQSIRELLTTGGRPQVNTEGLAKTLTEPRGCFVTLTKHGQLRGCIGHIVPQEALWKAVSDNARSAATRDPRFPPVQREELDSLEIEISVLTEPRPLRFTSSDDLLAQLRPHTDGVVLQVEGRSATYLPQVWSHLPDKVEFLDSLAEKAGCERSAWRKPGASVATYQVESFKEGD
jgi:AmmeMemoRadiSam system protein B/AmmeMemoRadiSam system protein A